MGLRPPERRDSLAADGGDDTGEWTTVISKFHFVDLAGSERVGVVFFSCALHH
jgi:kinesin family protein 4/21/27